MKRHKRKQKNIAAPGTEEMHLGNNKKIQTKRLHISLSVTYQSFLCLSEGTFTHNIKQIHSI